jgi:hypothetical protein
LQEMAELVAVGIEDQIGRIHRIPPESKSKSAAPPTAGGGKDVRDRTKRSKGKASRLLRLNSPRAAQYG